MSKVTTKLQVTIPKAIATEYAIVPGDELEWLPAGDALRVVPAKKPATKKDMAWRLALFDQSTERQRERARKTTGKKDFGPARTSNGRGWTREELYQRGRSSRY